MLIKELFTWYPNDYHSRTSFFHPHIVSCTCICLNDTITKFRSRTSHSAMSSFHFSIQMKFTFWYEISFWYYVNWKQTSVCFFFWKSKNIFKKNRKAWLRTYLHARWLCFLIVFLRRVELKEHVFYFLVGIKTFAISAYV